MIKAPYNFVPLNEQVFFPDWADKVSHDVPFSDGESGCITIKLTAKSPIYVRNGGVWPDGISERNNNSEFQSFSKTGCNKYFIPGTSIKGMIRNVLEILSFCKIGIDRVNNHRFSYRDLNDDDYKGRITESCPVGSTGKTAFKPKVKSGWLKGNPGALRLFPCKFARVEQQDLIDFHGGRNINLSRGQSSLDKYRQWKEPLDISFNFLMNNGEIQEIHRNHTQPLCYKKAIDLGQGTVEGKLVFTGQPNGSNKHLEFIFYCRSSESIRISKELEENFLFIHAKDGKPSKELNFWLDANNCIKNEIPVFYLEDEDGSIHSMGLAMMYRLPFDKSIHDLIPPKHKITNRLDLSEIIFGTLNNTPLKGRVQFSNAFVAPDSKASPMPQPTNRILGSPKASFYPNYLEKGASYKYSTSKIRGRKRYPIHPGRLTTIRGEETNNNVSTSFTPLRKGVSFLGKVRFHNLRKAEIGALLSALTFHGNQDSFFHSIGMAKPLGCGKISLSIEVDIAGKSSLPINYITERLDSFVKEIENTIGNGFTWATQPQITEFLTMSYEQCNTEKTDAELTYMSLKEHITVRRTGETLPRYSALNDYGVQKISLDSIPTIDLTIERIRNKLDQSDVQGVISMRQERFFEEALVTVLLESDYQENWRELYNLPTMRTKPVILAKIVNHITYRRAKELATRIDKDDIRLDDKNIQTIFLGIQRLAQQNPDIDNFTQRENLPNWVTPFAFRWEHLALNEDQLIDEVMEDSETRPWPPVEELSEFISQFNFNDDNDRQELIDMLSNNNDSNLNLNP